MAKAKAKAAVKRATAKPQTRALAVRPAKAPKKTAAAKPAEARVAKAKASPAKAAPAKLAKPAAAKAPLKPTVAKVAVAKPDKKPVAVAAPRTTGPLTLPVKSPVATSAANPLPVVARKVIDGASPRADLPPADGFTLLVDGHFKSKFDDLKHAQAAASELKGRFPMLRVEIYDAAKKERLPA